MSTPNDLNVQAAQLREQAAALDRQAQALKDAARTAKIADAKRLIQEYNITASELGLSASGKGRRGVPKGQHPSRGKKVAAKYSDGTNSWTGRGMQPGWLKAALASGKTLQSLAIAA